MKVVIFATRRMFLLCYVSCVRVIGCGYLCEVIGGWVMLIRRCPLTELVVEGARQYRCFRMKTWIVESIVIEGMRNISDVECYVSGEELLGVMRGCVVVMSPGITWVSLF